MVKTDEKNIEWWKENVKVGDEVIIHVNNKYKNYWRFNDKKGIKSLYFDGISYPREDVAEFCDPAPRFQLDKKDIGDKSVGFAIPVEYIITINSINGIEVEHKHKTERAKRMEIRLKYISNNFDVRNINGRWVCPCWSPDEPNKYSYLRKDHAVFLHKRHLARQSL